MLKCKRLVHDLETRPVFFPLMSFSFEMLSAFVRVADKLGVSTAATELGISKSLVSKRVAQLEAALGVTLFSRSSHRIALTSAGEAYLEFAQRALAEVKSGQERLHELRVSLSGKIRVTAPVSWGQRVLAKHLPEFLLAHPAVELELHLADRMMDIATERIDLALRWSDGAVKPGLAAEPLIAIAWMLAAAPNYLARHGTPKHPHEIAAHHGLGYWRENADDAWVLSPVDATATAASSVAVRINSRYHANNTDAVTEAALAGLGIALMPDYLCTEDIAAGRLIRVLPTWIAQTRYGPGITVVAAPERLRLARNQALLAFLRLHLG